LFIHHKCVIGVERRTVNNRQLTANRSGTVSSFIGRRRQLLTTNRLPIYIQNDVALVSYGVLNDTIYSKKKKKKKKKKKRVIILNNR
jgi:hypothetical protein